MTGFKSGASNDDPLGNDDDSDGDDNDTPAMTDAEISIESDTDVTEEPSTSSLPWIYARNGITDGRARTVQLHLQQSTLDKEQAALRDVDITESVNKADLREAAYLVGLANLDAVAGQLREWGYDAE
ncbi:hypothetical protein HISP_17645 (plasmid) [Haloarcula hispanica N601]|jgi:hypothetical protein|uniref:Uncharacterized protein n=4 Tax=Haloarcula TaxID=2237 RepID=M0JJK9_9EURY|nr:MULTISPECIES: hypothetical protein [Haloarcula]AEM58904.1 conserved hypothetical protein [Haloarcula hispanica ATCC 33960]AHB67897.1 hypothetical protein HISP_17645 [Haloarcula hispanica N601]AUG49391.1 hypothetical protein BVU17_17535 [Haloarcula taiwanensis]EMA09201.1 hypothetical protein C436_19478 [Haloarcula sinaiiensis ATCC 33800]KAA9400989.1 hypothetical protein Har1131_20390 [Haloarcula sp. CBA1131]